MRSSSSLPAMCAGRRQIADDVKRQSRKNGERNVHGRPGCGNQHHVASRVAQAQKLTGTGLA